MNIYTIKEYESFITDKNIIDKGYVYIPVDLFNELENYVLNSFTNNVDNYSDFMTLYFAKGIGKAIKVKNYVGILSLNSDNAIQILPKINNMSDIQVTKIFFDMIACLDSLPLKLGNISNLDVRNISILDIFVDQFLEKVELLIKKGLKCDYLLVEENSRYIKGKIMFTENLRHNPINLGNTYIQYDHYSLSRPENKLIKSSLLYLLKIMKHSSRMTYKIHKILYHFSEIKESSDYFNDFQKCKIYNRDMNDYKEIVEWCKIILNNMSPTPFAGNNQLISFLFPMEKIFEMYVAKMLIEINIQSNNTIFLQDNRYYLYDNQKKFKIKPDIVIKKKNGEIIIADTKWKYLDSSKTNYNIKTSDMYQAFVYQKKYNATEVILLYPKSELVSNEMELSGNDGVNVKIRFIDLENIDMSIKRIFNI